MSGFILAGCSWGVKGEKEERMKGNGMELFNPFGVV